MKASIFTDNERMPLVTLHYDNHDNDYYDDFDDYNTLNTTIEDTTL